MAIEELTDCRSQGEEYKGQGARPIFLSSWKDSERVVFIIWNTSS